MNPESAKFIFILSIVGIFLFFGYRACGGSSAAANKANIDLEAVSEEFERHVRSGATDFLGFERAINDKNLYKGNDYVKVTQDSDKIVVGYVDAEPKDGKFSEPPDTAVFKLGLDRPRKRLVAYDAYGHRYRHGIGSLMVAGGAGYLLGRMMHPRSYYSRWTNWSYMPRGYYRSYGFHSRPYYRPSSSHRFGSTGRSRSYSGGGYSYGK